MMGLAIATLWSSTFFILKAKGGYAVSLWVTNLLFISSISLCFAIWLSPPGYLERKPGFDFVEILEKYQSSSVCPDCEVLKTPRSRHCNLCNRCVDRFDHHCPWVNNCIGRKNFRYFYSFVVT